MNDTTQNNDQNKSDKNKTGAMVARRNISGIVTSSITLPVYTGSN